MAGQPAGALAEWRRWGFLPVAAMIGYSTIGIQTFGIGPFVAPLQQEFGWSRAEIMAGLTISNAIGVLCNFAVGLLVDRFGPRRVGITGIVVKSAAIALLATATGAVLNWSLLWVLVALGAMLVQATVWTSAVASRFDRGRGLAMAVALSGSSFAAAILPVLVTWLIGDYGWRVAFVVAGLGWMAVALPVTLLLFRGKQDEAGRQGREEARAASALLPGVTVREGLRMPAFWRLTVASFAFAFYTLAISPSLVPLLTDKGATPLGAAQIAAMMGIVSIVARISAGFLLDRLPATPIGVVVFLLPVLGCGLLLLDAPGQLVLLAAVVSFGITIGAEYDVVFYMTSRHFGLKSFGALIGGMLTAGAAGAAVAPLAAGWIFDTAGSYDPLLVLLMAMMGLAAIAVGTIGRPRHDWGTAHA